MDIFGTIINAISLAGKLVNYVKAMKDAEQDRLELISEISVLKSLLEILRGRVSNPSKDSSSISDKLVKAGINRPLRACVKALESIVGSLEHLAPNVNVQGASLSEKISENLRKFKWPFHKMEIKEMLSLIERLKTLILLALQTSLIEFVEEARGELATAGLNVEAIKSVVSSLEANQRAHTKLIEGGLHSLGAELRRAVDGMAEMQHFVVDNITEMVAKIDRNQQGQERQNVLNWLSAPDFDQKRATAFRERMAGTGEWFLKHSKFEMWRQGKYNVLWCPGNPGVGKSIMTSIIIRHLQKRITGNTAAVVFIYFDYTAKYTLQQLVEALLSQFVRQGMSVSNMKSLQKHIAGYRPTLDKLWAILEAEVETYAQVFVVIDALDEAAGTTWIPLLRRLRKLPKIRILATSRDLGNTAMEFKEDQRLDIMSKKGDLEKYVKGRISGSIGSFERFTKDPSLHAEVVSGVTAKADGMFLLAQLHMNALETKSSIFDLRQALEKLPGDLGSTYDAIMGRISDNDKPLALRIFSWVIRAARPMMIHDLQYALAVEDGMSTIDTGFLRDPADLMSVCVGLVVLRRGRSNSGENDYVELVHYTTQDYLRNYAFEPQLPRPVHLAITCLKYLAFDAFNGPLDQDSGRKLMNTPLTQYAIDLWGEHAREHYDDPSVRQLAMELLRDHRRVAALGFLTFHAERVSAIQLCAYFGLRDYLIRLLDNSSDINSRDSNGDTALAIAANHNHEEILELLLKQGVDVNTKGSRGATPLIQAVMSGHGGIAKLLLARGDVNINSQDESGYTPLAWAILKEHEAVVRLLLARGDLDISLKTKGGSTYLTLAARNNNDRIVKLLLDKGGIDINSRNAVVEVALAVAAYRGHDAVVKVLLAQDDIDINAMDLGGRTPLDWAGFSYKPIRKRDRFKSFFRPILEFLTPRPAVIELLLAAGARSGAEPTSQYGPGELRAFMAASDQAKYDEPSRPADNHHFLYHERLGYTGAPEL